MLPFKTISLGCHIALLLWDLTIYPLPQQKHLSVLHQKESISKRTSQAAATMASPTSSETILKFTSFKEELHALLDNFLDQAETLQTTAEEPVVLDRESIVEKLRDQITTENYVLESGAMQVT